MKANLILNVLVAVILGVCVVLATIVKDWSITFSCSFMFLLEILLCIKIYKLIKQ